ncbi:MAG: radical SAM protein [Candidatus Bathyarchaeia archaeon]
MKAGYKFVLTADRTLMSEYGGSIFLGFSACVPKGLIPDRLYYSMFCPSVKANEDGSAELAPCGTRKVEASLIRYGFQRESIVVAHPDYIGKVVGSETKVVGITENDPLGIGPATSTFTQLFSGEAYMALKFKELLSHPAIKRYRPKIIVGGPGAWQLEDPKLLEDLGIDCVVVGEGEAVVGPLFERAAKGETLPKIVYGSVVPEDEIPTIVGPTISGIVEIARGCGRGCRFCMPTMRNYRCLPLDRILKEVEVNLQVNRQPLLHAEDILRYKAKGLEINYEAVTDLFKAVKNCSGVKTVGVSHFALSSVVSAPGLVEEISNILGLGENGCWLGVQTGIETGSPRLIKEHMLGKCRPFDPKEWPEIVVNSFEVLSKNYWVPCATIILGLPGEEEEDINLTIDLVEKLRGFRSLIVPLFLVSTGGLKGRIESFTIEKMTLGHSELFLKCWEHNFHWTQVLLDDLTKRKKGKRMLKLLLSFGIRYGERLIHECQNHYSYDLPRMVSDVRNRKKVLGSLPNRLFGGIMNFLG